MKILRMPAVLAETGLKSHTSIYNAIRDGRFTKPVRISLRAVGWLANEVEMINAAHAAGQTTDQIKELVERLHLKRQEWSMG